MILISWLLFGLIFTESTSFTSLENPGSLPTGKLQKGLGDIRPAGQATAPSGTPRMRFSNSCDKRASSSRSSILSQPYAQGFLYCGIGCHLAGSRDSLKRYVLYNVELRLHLPKVIVNASRSPPRPEPQ